MSEGKFDYKKPKIELSVETILFEVKEGGIFEGEFQIFSKNEELVKGFVISTNPCMGILSEPNFVSENYTVSYRFDGANCEAGQKESGQFILITDGGEFSIPYEATIRETYLTTSMEEVKDLSEFAQFAMAHKEEALSLFYSTEFETMLLKKNRQHRLVYHALIDSRSHAQAMEEFLIYLQKKAPVRLTPLESSIQVTKEVQQYELEVQASGDGYVGAIIKSGSAYIHLDKEILHEEDFINQVAKITFTVSEKSRSIHNWEVELQILCGNQTVKVPVVYDALEEGKKEREDLRKKRQWKRTMVLLYENWFLYRTNHLSVEYYKRNERNLALELQKAEDGRKVTLPEDYYVHLLNRIPEEAGQDRAKRKKALLALYKSGFHSPFLYYEMLKDMNEETELLTELGDAEVSALKWGCRYQFVSMRLLDRFMQLTAHEKQFSLKVFHLAEKFYEQEPLKEYLSILCSILIKGDRMEQKYHKYYEMGIQASLKLIGLCEAFIRSMDHSEYGIIPRSVLLYFVDAEPLPDTEREYLFANILYHEREYEGILYQYGEKIQSFIKEQMKKGKISKDLFYLYRRNFEHILISEEMLSSLPGILFKKKLVCRHPLITGAILYHQETRKVDYVPLVNQMAYIDLYTDQYQVVLLDQLGRRYVNSIPFDLQPLFEDDRYMRLCYEYNKEHPMLLYRLGRHTLKHGQSDARAMSVAKAVLTLPDVDEDFYWDSLKLIIDYYYENYEGDLLEEYLKKVDLSSYEGKSRCELLEYMIERKMYAPVLHAVEEYGFHGINPQKILRLASYLLKSEAVKEDILLLQMCMYAFRNNRYDTYSLEYLGKFMISSLKEMLSIWKTAFENSICIHELEENILAQSLFEENICEELFPVFGSFFERNGTSVLGRAFLRYVSYDSFVKECIFPEEFYRVLKSAILEGRLSDDFSKMSLLYYLSEQTQIEEELIPWIQKAIQEFLIQGMVMPFFKNFSALIALPSDIIIRKYLCCRGERDGYYYVRCSLKTLGMNQKERVKEIKMKEIMPGIYTMDLVVFDHEEVKYSIWQRTKQAERMITMKTLCSEQTLPSHKESRFDVLNQILNSQYEGEDDQIQTLAKDYIKKTQLMDCEWTLL